MRQHWIFSERQCGLFSLKLFLVVCHQGEVLLEHLSPLLYLLFDQRPFLLIVMHDVPHIDD